MGKRRREILTRHAADERTERFEKIRKTIGFGSVFFVAKDVERGHKNGKERHEMTTTGLIKVYNKRGELVTILIARPGQIYRYFKDESDVPAKVIELCIEHQRLGYNNW